MQELSLEQKRLWVDYQRSPNALTNYAQFCYKLSGKLNVARFEAAVSNVLSTCDLFRTQFEKLDERLSKRILSDVHPRLEICNLDDLCVEKQIEKILNPQIDFLAYPNYHIVLLEVSEEEFYFLASIPHILIDGFSANFLLGEVADYYNEDVSSVIKNQTILSDDVLEEKSLETSSYWRKKLKHTPSGLSFLQKNVKVQNVSEGSDRRYLVLNAKSLENLKNVARECGTTFFLAAFSVLSVVLYKYSHLKSFSVLYPVNTRNHKNRKAPGFFC